LFDGDRVTEQFRVATNPAHTGDELAVLLRSLVDLALLEGIVLCSSVPQLVREYEAFGERWAGVDLLVLGPGVPTGVPIRYDDPREVGPDRIANAVAARERHGMPCVVVDFGTSTNFDVVSAEGEFAGGVLAPGIEISMEALFARAARLPNIPFVAPERVISQTTVSALQSGLVYGFAGQVDAIVDRIRDELSAADAPVVATGGLAGLIAPHSRTITRIDPELTLQGLRLVWERSAVRPRP
jgi:type III pantothenate kinase